MLPLPAPRPIPPSPGGQLRADDVVGRDHDVERAWQRLDRASVRLNEPRRIGKTSVLTKMAFDVPDGWMCVRLSFQGVDTTAGMVGRALSALHQHQPLRRRIGDRLKQFLSATSVSAQAAGLTFNLAPSLHQEPLAALGAALRDVASTLDDIRLLLAWDEVPDMVLDITRNQGADEAGRALSTLRRFRDEDPESPLRWLFTGSIGMHHVLRHIDGGDSLVNDLDNLPLGPLDPGWSRWLAESLFLGAGVRYDKTAVDRLSDVTGGLPYLSHLVVQYARDLALPRVVGSDVDELFVHAVNDLDHAHQTTHFLSRVDRYYGAETATAEWLLDQLASNPATREELCDTAVAASYPLPGPRSMQRLLDWLSQDHYIQRDPVSRTYAWRYEPLRRVWQIRRG